MRIAIIVGGWYYPKHLYTTLSKINPPKDGTLELFTVSHRDPEAVDISSEMLPRVTSGNKYDVELYSSIITYPELKELGYTLLEAENTIGDYYFFNQWTEYYDYSEYDYVMFLHDDNYLLPEFVNILVEIFDKELVGYSHTGSKWTPSPVKGFDYIANSAVGNRKTARGSFSIWSKEFLIKIGGVFPMEGVDLTREGESDTPNGHFELADWNMVGHNLQKFVENNNFLETTFRLSPHYRISRFLIEGERGLIGNRSVLTSEMEKEYAEYIK